MIIQGKELSINTQTEDVHILQNELQFLGYDLPQDEISRSFFGSATHDAVQDFQRKRGLPPNGVVDERTAHAINVAVDAQRPVPDQFVVSGQIRHQDGTFLTGLIVKIFDSDQRGEIPLGEESLTDGRGTYEVVYPSEVLRQREKRRADLLVRVYTPEGLVLAESDTIFQAGDLETVDLTVEPRLESSLERELETSEFIFRLLNQNNGEPLKGYSIQVFDLDGEEEPVNLGFYITNPRGLFNVVYTLSPEAPWERRQLRVQVLDSAEMETYRTEITVKPDQIAVVDIEIPVPEIPKPPSPALEELNESLQLQLPDELLARLREENIRSVDDIRRAGGISEITDLPVEMGHVTVRTLESHASLSVLSENAELNNHLIGKGYCNIAAIARTPEQEFVAALTEKIGDEKAIELYRKAYNQDMLLSNMETMARTEQANRFKPSLSADLSGVSRCVCADCESAVSPLAYLADLLQYAVKNLRVNPGNKKITLSDLVQQFYQPFDKLPASCKEMDNKVRQVRLCIEVLRGYLKTQNLPAAGGASEKKFQKAERNFLIDAYESLLTELGTSFEEVRLVRNANDKTRKAFASKLGIDLDSKRPDQLDQLLLNIDSQIKSESEKLTANHLEILFGLVSTDIDENPRNPLSDGPTIGDDKAPQIKRWNMKGVEWNRNTDADGLIYVNLTTPATGSSEVMLYRDKAMQQLMASGTISTSTEVVNLLPENSSGLSGQIEIDHTVDSNKIRLIAIPKVLSWRLAYLRTVWKGKDWSSQSVVGSRPLVDPDLIGTSDLRTDLANNPAYDLWTKRSNELNKFLLELKTLKQTPQYSTDSERFQAILQHVAGNSLKALKKLKGQQDQGESIAAELTKLGLTNGAFKYLIRFMDLTEQHDPQLEILDSEWNEVFNILIEAHKRGLFQQWRNEEKSKNITLSPDYFKLRNTALTTYPPPKTVSLPAWRATQTDWLDWEDELESRIDQQDDLIEAFDDLADKTEVSTLEDFRDALINATAANQYFDTQAKWVTDYLLIDAKADTCQQTTRISQAIETMQNLLWSLRTGQLVDEYKGLDFASGIKDYFDQEWEWIGSYTTWRSAMMVFLYPENILLPTLRKKQTPAFQQLVKNLSKNRQLSPEQACQEAKTYSDYLRDICTLKLEASCHAHTRVSEGKCRDKKEIARRTLFYTFAQGSHTKTIYWSAYDYGKDNTDYAQSFWAVVPELDNVTKIIGAHPYKNSSDDEGYIYLFVAFWDEGTEKLAFIRYDLETQSWENEIVELELPTDIIRFDAVLNQRLDNWIPRLVIRDKDSGNVYTRRLAPDGRDWEDDDFMPLVGQSNVSGSFEYYDSFLSLWVKQILASQQAHDNQIVLSVKLKSGEQQVVSFEYKKSSWFNPDKSSWEYLWGWFVQTPNGYYNWPQLGKSLAYDEKWIGSFLWKDNTEIYAFWREGTKTFYRRVKISKQGCSLVGNQNTYITQLEKIAIDSGPLPSKTSRNVAYQFQKSSVIYRKPFTRNNNDQLNITPAHTQIAPDLSGPFEIAERNSQKELQKRRKRINSAWSSNKGGAKFNLIYLEEAYYYVPMQLALQLQKQKYYIAALDWFRNVYDYTIPEDSSTESRKIYYWLSEEESLKQTFGRYADWLRDPLDPHLIATTRLNAYTRFTLQSIVNCLLDYADTEFTTDTSESIAKARTLYRKALKLLESKELEQDKNACEKIGELIIDIEDAVPDSLKKIWIEVTQSIKRINNVVVIQTLVAQIRDTWALNDTFGNRLARIQDQVNAVVVEQPYPKTLSGVLIYENNTIDRNQRQLLSDQDIFDEISKVGKYPGFPIGQAMLSESNEIWDTTDAAVYSIRPLLYFCISHNPLVKSLQLQAQLNLHKLRTCRNIAGLKRTVSPYSAATDQISGLPQIGTNGNLVLPGTITIQPTLYRYSALIAHAKELVNIAQQMEATMLAAIEKTDSEAYNRLKAKQDIELANSQVKLQTLRVKEAKDGVKLAELQKAKSQIMVDEYTRLLSQGLSDLEETSMAMQITIAATYVLASAAAFANVFSMDQAKAYEYTAKAAEASASIVAQYASFERRAEDWEFQKSLASQDVLIGSKQIDIAQDQLMVVGQEQTIARLQQEHAKDTLEFLANKFTNAELYDWMSNILEEVYADFLQAATAMAKLAENQLAFERQAAPASYIQNDYWEAPSEALTSALSSSSKTTDRRGLTGAARLLQDLYKLDQYAFDTDKRKLQLTKTISLAALSPVEFQQFRETGTLAFKTTMAMFDHDFPGQYLRLVKRVRISVNALIPPTQGIRATLSTPGLSRVVIGGTIFQTANIKRTPELIALSSAQNASGLFELQEQTEMLLPFEGSGVDTSWEFRLPKPANQFDYSTIADVFFTIDYTALYDTNYRQQLLQTLGSSLSADRAFSFRHEFADAWYDLHNPDQTSIPMEATFKTRKQDFPPNIENLSIQQIVLYFSKSSGVTESLEIPVQIAFKATDSAVIGPLPQQDGIKTIDGIISTRRSHASDWLSFIDSSPIGEWTIKLPNNDTTVRELFAKDKIEDILFVITYKGRTLSWD
ncbi:MAG: peptidoglycan-binding protein [Burkholderiales bacterium]|nr:peptidoglycan-binding protein [Nitrosomonas sp.]MCP5274987.1 peptidoglycan-binding protein [Burkholderiales bacterium]